VYYSAHLLAYRYLNNTNMLDPAYGTSADCLACNDKCNNDMLLMTGYLCHACLPNPCQNGAPCANIIGKGYDRALIRIRK
jgi:hypothetical protein